MNTHASVRLQEARLESGLSPVFLQMYLSEEVQSYSFNHLLFNQQLGSAYDKAREKALTNDFC